MSNSRLAIALLLLVFISPVTLASPGSHRNNDRYKEHEPHHPFYGKVIFAKPIYERVIVQEPQLNCTNHSPRQAGITVVRQSSPERAILGGIMGGIVGHELGNEHNREISTLAGVIIGSAIARDTRTVNYQVTNYETGRHRHCVQQTRIIEQKRLVGYKVKYKYRGRIFTTRTRHHPGELLPIRPGPQINRYHM